MIKIHNIPLELRKLNNWLGYKLIKVLGKKDNKIPISLITGKADEWTEMKNCVSFYEAINSHKRFNCDGIGLVLQPPYVGIDIDKSVDLTIAKEFNSYTEYSPSKTGYHIIVKGEIPRAKGSGKDGIEIYTQGRWFTITGDKIPGFPLKIVEANGCLAKYFESDKRSTRAPTWVETALEDLSEGNRNNTFTSIAGKLKYQGMRMETTRALLLPHANQVDFPVNELDTLIQSVYSYKIGIDSEAISLETLFQMSGKTTWLVPQIIPSKGIIFFAGLSESGKTWLLQSLALDLAQGDLWLGRFSCSQSRVLYIDQERGIEEVTRRFKRLLAAKNLTFRDFKDKLFLPKNATTRINFETSFNAFKKLLTKIRPQAILIDSFATFHTKEENNRAELQQVFENIKLLRDEFNCVFIFLDHEGKSILNPMLHDKLPNAHDMMGSAAKVQVAEGVLTIRPKAPSRSTVYHTKNNMGKKIDPFTFEIVDLDKDKTVVKIL